MVFSMSQNDLPKLKESKEESGFVQQISKVSFEMGHVNTLQDCPSYEDGD